MPTMWPDDVDAQGLSHPLILFDRHYCTEINFIKEVIYDVRVFNKCNYTVLESDAD